MATWAEMLVPPRCFTGAEIAWVAFVAVQALDGVLSYIGVATIGSGIEANPLLAWYLHMFGPLAAFLGAKLFAVGCGLVLYQTRHYRWVAGLTGVYLVVAIGPWIHLLSSHRS